MTALSMTKGETLSLSKASESKGGLHKVFVGAGWDVNATGGATFDADLFAIMLGADGKKAGSDADSIAFFGSKKPGNGSVFLHADNLTGEGEGDDENLSIDFDAIPANVSKVVVGMSIYQAKQKGQKLADLQNAFVRVVTEAGAHGELKDGGELAKFTIQGAGMTGITLVFGELVRGATGWEFVAKGDQSDSDLAQLAAPYGFQFS